MTCRPLEKLGDIRRDPPRLVLREQLGGRSYRPILLAFAIIAPEGGASGSKEWNGSSGKHR